MAKAHHQAQTRLAAAADFRGILRADRVAASGDSERTEFLQHSVDRGECRVYLDREVVAGFAIVNPAHFFGRDFVELLAVHPDHRRSGIGRILLREAVAAARTARVFTSTNQSNRAMRALLAAEGWSLSGGLDGLDEGDRSWCSTRTAGLRQKKGMRMEDNSAAEQIDAIIKMPGDWRGETLSRLRVLIKKADPGVVEEVKWKKPSRPEGVPVWSHDGILCTADTLKSAVRLTFPKGAQIKNPSQLFNTRLDSKTVRAIDFREGDAIDEAALKALILEAVRLNKSKAN